MLLFEWLSATSTMLHAQHCKVVLHILLAARDWFKSSGLLEAQAWTVFCEV